MIRKEHFDCDCGAEVVRIVSESKNDAVFVSIIGGQLTGLTGWRERLRHIWHIIRHGSPYEDQLVLRSKVAREMGLYLIEASRVAYYGSTKATGTSYNFTVSGDKEDK